MAAKTRQHRFAKAPDQFVRAVRDIFPTGPIQHCADLPKKKQKKLALTKDKLVVVRVTAGEMEAVHRFLKYTPYVATGTAANLTPLLQGIARGWIMQP